MPPRELDELGDLQKRILELLWQGGEGTVHDVLARIPDDPKPAYTTILTVLQKLEKAGWVTHRRDGRSHVYRPRQSHDEARAGSLKGLMSRVFSGDPKLLVQTLIKQQDMSADDLVALQSLIEQRKREMES